MAVGRMRRFVHAAGAGTADSMVGEASIPITSGLASPNERPTAAPSAPALQPRSSTHRASPSARSPAIFTYSLISGRRSVAVTLLPTRNGPGHCRNRVWWPGASIGQLGCQAGEPGSVADLHAERQSGQRGDTAQTAQPVHLVGEPRRGGHHRDLLIETIPRRRRAEHRVEIVVERRRRVHVVEPLTAQPQLIDPGPGMPTGVDDPLPQKQFRQPVPNPIKSARSSSRARTKSRSTSISRSGTRGDLTQAQQPGQMRRITGVFTRCPAGRCSFDGAATTQSIPASLSARANPNPVSAGSPWLKFSLATSMPAATRALTISTVAVAVPACRQFGVPRRVDHGLRARRRDW